MESTENYRKNFNYLVSKYGSQFNLAMELGVDPATITRNNGSRDISDSFLQKITRKLRYDLEDILHNDLENIDREIRREYHAYFLTTASEKEEDIRIDTASIEVNRNKVDFTIELSQIPPKNLKGKISIDSNLIYLNMSGIYEGTPFKAYISLPYYRISKAYIGGLGLIMLPSETTTLPCVHKVVMSCVKLDLSAKSTEDCQFLYSVLKFNKHNLFFQKITHEEDKFVHRYINKKMFDMK